MNEANPLDINHLVTGLMDGMVEAVANSLCHTPVENYKMQAALYQGIAQVAPVKAAMAKGIAEDMAKEKGGTHAP